MVTRNRGFEQLVPIRDHSSLSLLLKTFDLSDDASEPYDFDDKLGSVQNTLKSVVAGNPNKLRELARNIVNDIGVTNNNVAMEKSSKILPSAVEVNLEGKKRARFSLKPNSRYEGNLRERRPGLVRKRAKFSLKPESSQHVVNIEPTMDVKNLNDPEEFFKAYERQENAKREIQRQMGGDLTELDLHNTSCTNRPRRPGLLDHKKRKTFFNYISQTDDFKTSSNVVSSQEQTCSSIPSQEYQGPGEEIDHDFASKEANLDGSVSTEEEKLDKILDHLLSFNVEELEGDRVISVLQERLQIKPIELQKLNLPDFPDVPKMKMNSGTSGKFKFSSITKMYLKDGLESITYNTASPTPQKSPFASVPSLIRRITRTSPSSDPFSADDSDFEASPSFEQLNKEFSGTRKSNTESPLPEVDKSSELPGTSNTKLGGTFDVDTSASCLQEPHDMDTKTDNELSNDKLITRDIPDRTQINETVVNNEVHAVDETDEVPKISVTAQPSNDKVVAFDVNVRNQTNETTSRNESHVEDVIDEQQETSVTAQPSLIREDEAFNNGSEELIENNQEQSKSPYDEKHKSKCLSGKAQKRQEAKRRQSLAVPGIGTTWEAGVRRSTRIRVKPLRHWKGERLLYGRIHYSLPTVIGLKYIPPDETSENPILQVKSYVGDEYKELVEIAALH